MMGVEQFITHACIQTAVYWGEPVPDGFGGRTFDSAYPEEISCRWEARKEVISDGQGNEIISRARVYVTQDLEEEGWLFLGTLDDLDSAEEIDPMEADGAYKIKRFDKTPSIRGDDYVRIAYL